MSIWKFIKWLHYEFPISSPAANWHTQYPAALAVDECRSSPGRCASEQCVTTDQSSGFTSPLTPMEITNPFLCVALSEGEKWSSSPFREDTSHPVSSCFRVVLHVQHEYSKHTWQENKGTAHPERRTDMCVTAQKPSFHSCSEIHTSENAAPVHKTLYR